MSNPVLTIAIPVFERTTYFERALKSALNQECPCDVIVVDNGSSHNEFRKICDKYGAGVRYYRNDSNLGMFANWNRCFLESATDFVFILGDDDLVHPSFSRHLEKALHKHGGIDVFYTDIVTLEMKRYRTLKCGFAFPFGLNTGTDIFRYAANHGLGCPTVAMAIRRRKFTGFFSGLTASNDWYWLYSEGMDLNYYGLEDALVMYRKHPASDTSMNSAFYGFSHATIYAEIAKRLHAFPDDSLASLARAERILIGIYRDREKWEKLKRYYRNAPSNPYIRIYDEHFSDACLAEIEANGSRIGAFTGKAISEVYRKIAARLGSNRSIPSWISCNDHAA